MQQQEIEMANALAECLEAAQRGPEALREALGRYPVERQSELAQLVQIARTLSAAGVRPAPSSAWRAMTGCRLMRGRE